MLCLSMHNTYYMKLFKQWCNYTFTCKFFGWLYIYILGGIGIYCCYYISTEPKTNEEIGWYKERKLQFRVIDSFMTINNTDYITGEFLNDDLLSNHIVSIEYSTYKTLVPNDTITITSTYNEINNNISPIPVWLRTRTPQISSIKGFLFVISGIFCLYILIACFINSLNNDRLIYSGMDRQQAAQICKEAKFDSINALLLWIITVFICAIYVYALICM